MQQAVDSVPDCPSREAMRGLVRLESERLVPASARSRVLQVVAG